MHTRTIHQALHSLVEFTEKERKGGERYSMCVCVQETHSGAVLISCTEDIVCDKKKIEQKLAGRETARKRSSEVSDTSLPLTLCPEKNKSTSHPQKKISTSLMKQQHLFSSDKVKDCPQKFPLQYTVIIARQAQLSMNHCW